MMVVSTPIKRCTIISFVIYMKQVISYFFNECWGVINDIDVIYTDVNVYYFLLIKPPLLFIPIYNHRLLTGENTESRNVD